MAGPLTGIDSEISPNLKLEDIIPFHELSALAAGFVNETIALDRAIEIVEQLLECISRKHQPVLAI